MDSPLKKKRKTTKHDKPVVPLPKAKGKAKKKLQELSEGEAWPHSEKGIIKGGKEIYSDLAVRLVLESRL